MNARRRAYVGWTWIVVLPLLSSCDSSTEPEAVGSILLNAVDTELAVGTAVQLVSTVVSRTGSSLPGHPVTWNSSQPTVASVSPSGLVTALSVGSSTVTAESGGKSASVTFTVKAGACIGASAGSISTGQTRTGSLGPADCSLFHLERAAGWTFSLSSRTTVEIHMTSASFSPLLVVTDTGLNDRMWGYPHGVDGVRAVGDLPAGQYIVWASSYDPRPTGGYELSVREVQSCGEAAAVATMSVGETFNGNLDENACLFLGFTRAQGVRLSLSAPTGVRIDLASTRFDALLIITDLQMEVLWWNDDWGSGTDSRIERRLPAGDYLVWALAWDMSFGSYQLSVLEVDIPLCPAVGSLAVGESVTGTLSTSDCVFEQTRYADPWTMTVSAPTTVQIDLTSSQFDAFLIVEREDGTTLAWDDDGGAGLNSRLIYTFPAGEYRVVATSFWEWETGAYQLSARPVAGAATANLGQELPVWALPGAKSRKP